MNRFEFAKANEICLNNLLTINSILEGFDLDTIKQREYVYNVLKNNEEIKKIKSSGELFKMVCETVGKYAADEIKHIKTEQTEDGYIITLSFNGEIFHGSMSDNGECKELTFKNDEHLNELQHGFLYWAFYEFLELGV